MSDTTPERRRDQKSFWDGHADWNAHIAIYDTAEVRDPATREAAFEAAGREDARRMAWFCHPDARVLDLGCGMGRVMRPLAPFCREVVGVDISRQMLDQAEEYLAGVDGVRLVETDGATLPGVADGSIDFAYSLLCLIHVDKRSAYRYLREIRRALRPGGMALLQFQNILTDEGLAKFVHVLDQDYPLEFYTPGEVGWLLGSVGLEVLTMHPTAEYIFVTVLNGSAEAWRRELAAGLEVSDVEATGLFADATSSLSAPGELRCTIRSRVPGPRTLLATLTLSVSDRHDMPHLAASAPLVIPADASRELRISYPGGGEPVTLELDGHPAALSRSSLGNPAATGRAVLDLGLLPSGFQWNQDTLAAFPGLFVSRPLELVSA